MTSNANDTMRAAVLRADADAPAPEEVALPQADSEHLMLDVRAAALNPVDLRVAAGTHPTIRPSRPYVPGFEGVGRVVSGAGSPGRLVWWLGGIGTFAQRAVVRADQVVDVPDGLADDAAAAIGISGMAAWLALVYRARVQPGDRVLVVGATGAVGRFAIQIARLLGAARVVAAGRSAGDDLLELGADAAVPLTDDGDLTAALLQASPGGYHVVVDVLFGPPGEAAIRAATKDARIVIVGARAGREVKLGAMVFEQGLTILGHRNSATPLAPRQEAYRAVAGYMAAGSLRVDREVFPLADVADAWRRQADSPHRKLVIVP